MKDRFRISISITKYLLLAGFLIITFTTNGCKEENESDYYCEVVINGPNTTVFNENENISFSAHLEDWYKFDHVQNPSLYGVRWESDIDGTISTQNYNPAREKADHSFTISNLSIGNHNIKCYTIDAYGDNNCSDKIYIEILPENQIEYLDFSFTLDEAETKTTFSTGTESYGKRIRHDLSSNCGESTFSDNIYTTIFDGRCSSITGYMTVTFLDNPDRVDVHAEWSRPSSDCISNYTVDYEGIPYDGPNGTASDLYYENGSAVSRINISQYEVICTAFTKELLNTNCGNDAEIGVWVYYLE